MFVNKNKNNNINNRSTTFKRMCAVPTGTAWEGEKIKY